MADGTDPHGRPIRVALLAPALNPGGAERQMLLLAANLPRDRFDVRFVTLATPGALAAEAQAIGLRVDVLGVERDTLDGSIRSRGGALWAAVRRYRELTREIDVVDAWLVPAYTFAGSVHPLARVPVLVAGRRSALDVARTRTRSRELAGSFAMRAVAAVVANSRAAADQAIELEGIAASKVHVIHNAVEPMTADPALRDRTRTAWGFAPTDLVLGCVGNFKPGKGQELLLEVATRLHPRRSNLRFVFVGDGPLRGWLADEIERRGLTGHVVLHSGESDARRLYGAFDIAAQGSDSEGLPNAVLEAAAMGLPIAATAVGGTGEIVTDGVDGLLVPRGSIDGMTEAVERLVDDQDLRSRLGTAARARAQEFSPAQLAAQTGALYARLVSERR